MSKRSPGKFERSDRDFYAIPFDKAAKENSARFMPRCSHVVAMEKNKHEAAAAAMLAPVADAYTQCEAAAAAPATLAVPFERLVAEGWLHPLQPLDMGDDYTRADKDFLNSP
jgi:hypothetical protein